jgi:hypothetical protein
LPHWLLARTRYLVLVVTAVVLGLLVNRSGDALSAVARDVLGDALWAAMMVWFVSVVVPATRLRWRGAVALAICFIVEYSQLLHFPALDALRRTIAGQLVLGSGFDPRDLAAYTAGVLVATAIERRRASGRRIG